MFGHLTDLKGTRDSVFFHFSSIFSSSQRPIGELLVFPYSGVPRYCRQPFSNIFSSETAWPFNAKVHVKPPWQEGTKVYI